MSANFKAYWRLMRFDKPVGILLLWFPTAWALWLAKGGLPDWFVLLLFALGTVIMRAAGCVVNDIADRRFDKHVARTKNRPLVSGEISIFNAFGLLLSLLISAFIILIQLPLSCYPWAFAAVGITAIYPLCKRFLSAPQLVLGLAFSMGIPMAFVAQNVALNEVCIVIFVINFLWIVAYDTMYAMTDREDDLKIGVHSSAILFGSFDVFIITAIISLMHGLWLFLGYRLGVQPLFYVFWALAIGVLVQQYRLIRNRDPQLCFKAFRISVYYGGLMWIAVLLMHNFMQTE